MSPRSRWRTGGLGTVGLLLFLTGYRWLARRSRRALLIYGLSLFVVIAPLIVVGDTFALSQGYLAVGDGYTVWMDALVGVALLAVPVLAYELLRRRA